MGLHRAQPEVVLGGVEVGRVVVPIQPLAAPNTTAGRPNSAALALMACSEGIILHRIARHDNTDPCPLLRVVVKAALRD